MDGPDEIYLWIALASVVLWACRNEDLGPFQSQVEEEPITEEDLELIKERETNIRQLEVTIGVLDLQCKQLPYSVQFSFFTASSDFIQSLQIADLFFAQISGV